MVEKIMLREASKDRIMMGSVLSEVPLWIGGSEYGFRLRPKKKVFGSYYIPPKNR